MYHCIVRIDTVGSHDYPSSGSLPGDESHPSGEGQVETSETNPTWGAGGRVHQPSMFNSSLTLEKLSTLA